MPRRRISFAANEYYHIYNRGNNRGLVFYEDRNYEFFLQGIRTHLLPIAAVLAYCLMPTHYHMLVRMRPAGSGEDPSPPFSRSMQRLLISYTKGMNKGFGRVGALFQGAFQSRHIDSAGDLKHICRYIHCNPVTAGLCSSPIEWRFSDYADWLQPRAGAFADRAFIHTQFGSSQEYAAFVSDYVQTGSASPGPPATLADLEY